MLTKIFSCSIFVVLLFGLYPYSQATAAGDCYSSANQERLPRPSGAYGPNGSYIEFDYSHLPDPEDMIFVCVNNHFLQTDVPVVTEKGSSMLPMRALFEAIGAGISWDANTKTITAYLKDKEIQLKVDHSSAQVNGKTIAMSVPPRMKEGRVLVPVRFVSEQLNSTVLWQPEKKIIKIYTYPELSVQAVQTTVSSGTDDYLYHNYFQTSDRHLMQSKGQIILVESNGDELRIQEFAPDLVKSRELSIKKELPIFGGVHAGEDGYYYAVYAQFNMEESDTKSVYRIVKYDHTWAKAGQADIKGVNVTKPFHGSNLTMDSYAGKLVIYSARERYVTEDGLHHQSNITFQLNMKDMTVLYAEGLWPRNHVSHSFAAYVRFDEDRIVYADHGDAFPRSIVLQIEENETIINTVNLLEFPGEIGDNYTGAHLGGLEAAKDNYLAVGSSVSLTEKFGQSLAKNVFLAVVPKDADDDDDVILKWLTDFSVDSNKSIVETHLVKMDDNKFVLIWKEEGSASRNLFYAVVDGTGRLLQEPTNLKGVPSPGNMAPLVRGNTIIWYDYDYVYQNEYAQDGIEFFTLQVK